ASPVIVIVAVAVVGRIDGWIVEEDVEGVVEAEWSGAVGVDGGGSHPAGDGGDAGEWVGAEGSGGGAGEDVSVLVGEGEGSGGVTADGDVVVVDGAVVGAAQQGQVFDGGFAGGGPGLAVMDVEPVSVGAAGVLAGAVVAEVDGGTQ